MRTLSSSKIRSTKVITPLVVVGVSIAAAIWTMRSTWSTEPVYASCFVVGMSLFAIAYLWWSGYWRLADSVVETSEGVLVRRGQVELLVTFQEIARVEHRVLHSQSVCVLELLTPGALGRSIEFLPVSEKESIGLLGNDLWQHLEKEVASARPKRAT
jgi:hypothetical protein